MTVPQNIECKWISSIIPDIIRNKIQWKRTYRNITLKIKTLSAGPHTHRTLCLNSYSCVIFISGLLCWDLVTCVSCDNSLENVLKLIYDTVYLQRWLNIPKDLKVLAFFVPYFTNMLLVVAQIYFSPSCLIPLYEPVTPFKRLSVLYGLSLGVKRLW